MPRIVKREREKISVDFEKLQLQQKMSDASVLE